MNQSKVLIVDDTLENIQILMETLKNEHAVIAAKNGEKALKLARAEPRPDIILLDIMMPGMSGYEVCEELKKDIRTKNIPVIFVTALINEEDEEQGLKMGAVDYVTKPFRPGIIKSRVRNQLELKRHRDQLEDIVRERTKELAMVKRVTIESLATLAECRDPETGGHIKRTQKYVQALATHVMAEEPFARQLDKDAVEAIYLSAPLHDIGKVGVPDAILLKPGKLTEDEFEEMKNHAKYGSQSLAGAEKTMKGNSFLRYAREIAHSHHEKWDGSGYPEGLAGDQIPVSARIMAIADVYDALISKRVYKPPFSHAKAVAIITEGRGSQFDPLLTDAFLEIQDRFLKIAREYADFSEEREMLGSNIL